MRILFEEYHYDKILSDGNEIFSLASVLADVGVSAKHVENDTKLSIDYVGYFFSQQLHDCVFILPKVLMKEDNTLFDENLKPEDFLSIDSKNPTGKQKEILDFVYEFSVWVYRAIDVFRHRNSDSDIAVNPEITQMQRGRRRDRYTFVDIMLALLDFNRKNQDYLTFVLRNIHSGNNKINWTKTITQNNVIIQDGVPIYYAPINKKKQINYDEELLIIYFSILNHINNKYSFPVRLNANFDLITGKRFEQYIKGTGKRRLKQIKYKYFSDRDLEIWDLCYAFFDYAYKVAIKSDTRDFLLVHDFHAVFEDMVDNLLSNQDKVVQEMKSQDDNKRLDHLYRYKGLTKEEKDVYYIGDSKYYPRGAVIQGPAMAKQYTYARNLVQYDMDLFNSQEKSQKDRAIGYRDDETEGYDIVPNFFISAKIDDISDKGYSDSKIEHIKHYDNDGKKRSFYISYHFRNRLYDRDTILVSHYNINFLFVLALYAKNRSSEQQRWANEVKKQFRDEIIAGLNEEFQFHVLTPREGVNSEQFLHDHFQQQLGKLYSPYETSASGQKYYSLALDKDERYAEENEKVKALFDSYFYREECPLGTDPTEVLPKVASSAMSDSESSGKGLYFLSTVDKNVNAEFEKIAEGKGSFFISGYNALLTGIDFTYVKYFVAVIDHQVAGYYIVNSSEIFDATELLKKAKEIGRSDYKGYEKPYRVKLGLGDYVPLPVPFLYGIDNVARGIVLSGKAFKEYCKSGVEKKVLLEGNNHHDRHDDT